MREHSLVMFFIFLVLPLFDMVNGFLVVRGFIAEGGVGSPSQIGRFLATIVLLYACRRGYLSLAAIAIFMWLAIFETIVGFKHNEIFGVLFSYVAISKFLYMYLLYIFLVQYGRQGYNLIARYLKYNLNLINGSIVFAFFSGLANSTYGWGFGTKGFFASGNGLGIYIGVSSLVMLSLRHYRYYQDVGFGTYFLSLISLVLLGTKTAFVLALIVLSYILWSSRIRLLVIPLIALMTVYLWEHITSIFAVFFDIIIIRYKNQDSLLQYLFSNRDNYVVGAFSTFSDQDISIFRWLFGAGSFVSFQDPAAIVSFDGLETDFFDIFFMYGIVGVAGYLALIGYGIMAHFKRPLLLISMGLIAGHSLIAGHVVFNAMSSTLLINILAFGALFGSSKIGSMNKSIVCDEEQT